MTKTRCISLPEELCEKAERAFAHRFANLEEFLTVIMTDLLRDDGLQMDKREQEIVEQRLKSLGYV
jgi:hypothetical protein